MFGALSVHLLLLRACGFRARMVLGMGYDARPRGLALAAAGSSAFAVGAALSVVAGSSRLLAHPAGGSSVRVRVHDPLLPRSVRISGAQAARRGVWGVSSYGSYAQVGEIVFEHSDGTVSRRLAHSFGPALPSGPARMERAAFPRAFDACLEGFPALVRGISPSPHGSLLRWGSGAGSRVLVGVHGRGMSPSEMLRLWRPSVARGWGRASLSFRGDGFSEMSADASLGWGEAEDVLWHLYALGEEGVGEVVLSGMSFGGAAIANLILRYGRVEGAVVRLKGPSAAPLPVVSGLMFESPALDWPLVVGSVVSGMRVPRLFASLVVSLAGSRAHLDAETLRPIRRLDAFMFGALPALIVHGSADGVVPVSVSDDLVRMLPSAVYLRLRGGGHAEGFNGAPVRYISAVSSLLAAAGSPGGFSSLDAVAARDSRVPCHPGERCSTVLP